MFLDNALILSNAQSITSTVASTNVYDVTGAGVGNAPALVWGTSSVFGSDEGTGNSKNRPSIVFSVPVAFVSGGGATLQIQIEAAIDNGSNSNGTFRVLWQSAALTVAQLALGAQFSVPLPPLTPAFDAGDLPRFYQINYVVATSTFSAGKITAAICINPPSQIGVLYPSNFASV